MFRNFKSLTSQFLSTNSGFRRSAGCSNRYRTATSTKSDTYNTQSGSCSTNATKAGCKTDVGLPKQNLPTFAGKVVCYKRAPRSSSVVQRPKLSGISCPSGSKSCGSGGYANGQLCVANGQECPINILSGGFNGTALNASSSHFLNASSNRPIIEVRVTPGPG